MRGRAAYAGGARRVAVGAAGVAALLAASVAVGMGGVERAERVPPPPPATTSTPSESPSVERTPVLGPKIVKDHLAFSAARRADTAAYADRHYGVRTATLKPELVVLHFTESDTYASVRSLFAANEPNRGESPGTCTHYVVDQDGTVYELVPPHLVCRHAVGLNHLALGVEFVQSSQGRGARWAVQQILARQAQVNAGVGLVRMLQQRYAIPDGGVIGHAMANDAKEFRDLRGWRNDHVDWQRAEVERFRTLVMANKN